MLNQYVQFSPLNLIKPVVQTKTYTKENISPDTKTKKIFYFDLFLGVGF